MKMALIICKEDGQQKRFEIDSGKTIIGRGEQCDLRIPLSEVSRQHAVLIVDDKNATLRDLGSSNGSFVNNQQVTEQKLEPGDHLVIGPVVFTVQIDGEPAEIRPVKTKLEAKGVKVAAKVSQKTTATTDGPGKGVDVAGAEEEDPISALEAMAASDDTAEFNLDDSFPNLDLSDSDFLNDDK